MTITATPHPLSVLAHESHGFIFSRTHGLKTRLKSQGEHAHIRLFPKSSPADLGYYNYIFWF